MSGSVSTSGFEIPASLDDKMKEEIFDISKRAFKALNLSGVTRFDFLVDKKYKKIYVNEPNTIPGSLSFHLWRATGITYTRLLDNLIDLSLKRAREEKEITYSFDSNILDGHSMKGLKGLKGTKGAKI